MLQTLAGERRAAGGRAEQEAAAALVAERPDEIADALEAEHRIEDEERDHRLTPRRVRGPDGGHRRHRAGLGDPLLEDATVLRLAVREQEARVDRLVALPDRRVDLHVAEQRVETERARLVGDDRHDAVPELRIGEQLAGQPRERGGRRRLQLLARPGEQLGRTRSGDGSCSGFGPHDALGERAVEHPAAGHHVLVLGRVDARVVVGRDVVLELRVGDVEVEPVAEPLELRRASAS